MYSCTSTEKEILNKILQSLKDGNEYGNKREQFKFGGGGFSYSKGRNSSGSKSGPGSSNYGFGSGRYSYEDFFKRSHGSYQSSYDSGYKDGSSSGSKPKILEPKLDDYAVLGLSESATSTEIKKQFYKLAREHHPGRRV